jgi:hypothetical protein
MKTFTYYIIHISEKTICSLFIQKLAQAVAPNSRGKGAKGKGRINGLPSYENRNLFWLSVKTNHLSAPSLA